MKQRIVCRTPICCMPGMRLAREVTRADGAVLLTADSELDADTLAHLHQRGIEVVFVLEDDQREADTIAQDIAAAAARVDYLFRGEESPVRNELAHAVADYRQQGAA